MKNIIKKFLKGEVERRVVASMKKEGLIPIGEVQDDDVYIIGFPKSGHTWMQYILSSMVFGVSPEALRDSIVQELVPDVHVRKYYRRYHQKAIFKSHDLPAPHHKNVIYLVRDGRDAMVSYFEMYRKVINQNVSLEEMINDDKNVFPCSWSKHINNWLVDNPFKINLLVVKYEDLLMEPVQQLERVASFLQLSSRTEFLTEIVKHTHIDILRAKAKEHGMAHKVLNSPNGFEFFRKGQVKSYLVEMNHDLASKFQQRSGRELSLLGYLND